MDGEIPELLDAAKAVVKEWEEDHTVESMDALITAICNHPAWQEDVRETIEGLLSSLGMVTQKANELGGDFLAPHHMKWGVRGLALLERLNEETTSASEGVVPLQDRGSRVDVDAEGGDSPGPG